MKDSPSLGRIFTFYSYKGGTGRTMALANIACLLAQQHSEHSKRRRVLIMDWDLEAPGLHRYFPVASEGDNLYRRGVINYFDELRKRLEKTEDCYTELEKFGSEYLERILPIQSFFVLDVFPGVDLMKAGQFTSQQPVHPGYPDLVNSFDWVNFYEKWGGAFKAFRELLARQYDFVLIDSRTGLTDVGGICTMLLPECLVGVFTPNEQSLNGLIDVLSAAHGYRRKSNDFRPLTVFPLPSRIEVDEQVLRLEWRQRYQQAFEQFFHNIYDVEEVALTRYFDEVMIPHRSYFSYGEKLAVLEERPDALSLRRAYEVFHTILTSVDFAWDTGGEGEFVSERIVPDPTFDVFLSYRHGDERAAEAIARHLKNQAVNVYFDQWHLLPGQDLEVELNKALRESASVAVLVGRFGISTSQLMQVKQVVERDKRVIPVLLPGADLDILPDSLRSRVWVDLQNGFNDRQGLRQLVRGVTGKQAELDEAGEAMSTSERTIRYRGSNPQSAHFKAVANAIAYGRVVPVLGWGVSYLNTVPDRYQTPPTPVMAARQLAEEYGYPETDSPDFLRVVEFIEFSAGRPALHSSLAKLFGRQHAPNLLHSFIASVPSILRTKGYTTSWPAIVTLSFDSQMERALDEVAEAYERVVYTSRLGYHHSEKDNDEQNSPDLSIPILRLNGVIDSTHGRDDQLILTMDDYLDALTASSVDLGERAKNALPFALRETIAQNQFLYFGFGVRDWTSRVSVRRFRTSGFSWRGRKKSWAVSAYVEQADEYAWQSLDVELVEMDLESYVLALSAELESLPVVG